ncbi:MAG: metallophosphoesterase [Oscillospiraceae bacterium]|nr:metallophosphoesterase [Oscillospiraceae bacterium]
MNSRNSLLAASAAFGVLFPKTYREISTPDISYYNICSDTLPDSFDGFKAIHLSDLHNKVFSDNNARLISMIEAEEPDIIIMTGDMISHNAPNTEQYLTLVNNLCKICPVYYVNGNHELSDLDDEEFERVQNVLAEYGAVCLDNTSTEIYRDDKYIRLYGLCYTAEYYRGVRQYKRGWKAFMLTDMIDYIGIKQPDEFTVLLAHNPLDFDVHAEWGADISFGGHIHGGFIRLPIVKGLVSPERKLFPKYKEGVYKIGNSSLVVSRGLGNIRINNPPEIVSVTLSCNKGD